MLGQEAVGNLFNQIHTVWVEPELTRRREEGVLPDGFKIRTCRIKLPIGKPPIVEFNEEINWIAHVKKPSGIAFTSGDPVYLPQVEQIESVDRPTHDGIPVAFFFVFSTGCNWQIMFDCTPNGSVEQREVQDDSDWSTGRAIAAFLNMQLKELSVHMHDAHKNAIRSIGLWAAPALMPYPLSAIAEECQKDNRNGATAILLKYCNADFLEQLVNRWVSLKAFAEREQLFRDALSAHRRGQFTLSVHALVPHIEGVITDWVFTQVPHADVPWRQESKTKKFESVLQRGSQRTFTDDRIAHSIVDFILNGPLLSTFTDWLKSVGDEFPNRHVVGHGKYISTLYSEENSVKAFLVLDTLFHTMIGHSVV